MSRRDPVPTRSTRPARREGRSDYLDDKIVKYLVGPLVAVIPLIPAMMLSVLVLAVSLGGTVQYYAGGKHAAIVFAWCIQGWVALVGSVVLYRLGRWLYGGRRVLSQSEGFWAALLLGGWVGGVACGAMAAWAEYLQP